MNIIFQSKGGIGKAIMSTAIIEAIKKKNPEYNIIAVSEHPEVYANNKDIKDIYTFKNFTQLYYRYCENQDFKVFGLEPYEHNDFITGGKSLYEVWAQLCEVEYNDEWPKFTLTTDEIEKYSKLYKTDKPIFVLQTHGGNDLQGLDYNWARDLPDSTVEEIINHYKDDYNIYHIKRENQKSYANTIPATGGIREIAVLIKLSKRRLFIDSFAQHLAVALHKHSTICWVTTTPRQFSYKNPTTRYPYHYTVKANKIDFETEATTFSGYGLVESPSNLPYLSVDRIFEGVDIIGNIDRQKHNIF